MTEYSDTPSGDDARQFVISGCSGSGKSTLIAELAKRGEQVVPEPGRGIVQRQIEEGGGGLPWEDVQLFVELCARQAIRDFDEHAEPGRRVFFDRSFIDVVCAVERLGLEVPEGLESAAESKRYARTVFMSRPWESLFRPDAERRHGFAEAVTEYEALVPAYRRHGYEIVFLPEAPVLARVEFLLSTVRSPQE